MSDVITTAHGSGGKGYLDPCRCGDRRSQYDDGCMVSWRRKLHHGRDRPEADPGSFVDPGKV